jgi:hypothetical protein
MAARRKGNLAGLGGPLPSPRKRAPVEEGEARKFERGPTPGPRAVAGTPKRRAEGGVRLPVYVPPEVDEAVRDIAHDEKRSVSDLVTEALTAWLARRAPKK